MSVTTFLINEALWSRFAQIKEARHTDAAIAYFGNSGADLLPLKAGDRLVVDLSEATVRGGGTDPYEIEKLMRRGVRVFSRKYLHAKTILADNWLIVGSANISRRSKGILDEAALVTNDRSAIRRARDFFDEICTAPVGPEYIKECKKIYHPPRYVPGVGNRPRSQSRIQPARLWLVSLREWSLPERELREYEKGERQAERLLKQGPATRLDSFHWTHKPWFAEELQKGDSIIQILKSREEKVRVFPPARFLHLHTYARAPKRKRYVFFFEIPKRSQSIPFTRFVRTLKGQLPMKRPRTAAIRTQEVADHLLELWTEAGRLRRRP